MRAAGERRAMTAMAEPRAMTEGVGDENAQLPVPYPGVGDDGRGKSLRRARVVGR